MGLGVFVDRQSVSGGVGGGLGSVDGTGLVENVAHIVAHGLDADEEFLANRPVSFSPQIRRSTSTSLRVKPPG